MISYYSRGGKYFLNQRGVFPILILVAIGAALVVGGTYVVQNNLVTTKNGQIVFNGLQDQDLSDIKIPSPQPDSSDTPAAKNAELADKTAEYKPETGEPKFSITPPAGWLKSETGGKIKLAFEGPQEDKKEIGNGGYASALPNIQITVEKDPGIKNLDEAIAEMNSQTDKVTQVQIEKGEERKTTLNGIEAYYSEIFLSLPNVDYSQLREYLKQQGKSTSTEGIEATLKETKGRAVSYLLYKDGYAIGLSGVVLASAWDKRSSSILASLNSFKFLDNESTQKQPDPATQNNSLQTNKNTVPVFTIDNPDGWTNLLIPNAQTADYHGAEIDHPYDPNTHVRINIRKVYGSDLQQVVNKFKQNLPGSKVIQAQNLTINGLSGYLAEYKELGDDDYYQRHIYYFISFKDGFEINVAGRTFQRTWDKNGDTIKKAVQSFKLK